MVIHELTAGECGAALERAHVGRLACARADQPYVVPISFYADLVEKCLYSFSTLGQKIDWMRGNPKVCVEVDEIVDRFHWTSVIVFGRYEEVLDSPLESHARRRAHDLLRPHEDWWLPAAGKLASGTEHHVPVVYRIHIERMTGRRAAG